MSAPLTLAGLVARLHSETPPDQIRTHSIFHLRAALRVAREFHTLPGAPVIEDHPRDPRRATLCGVPVIEDPRVALGVVALLRREGAEEGRVGVLVAERTAAISSGSARAARAFASRMAFLGG